MKKNLLSLIAIIGVVPLAMSCSGHQEDEEANKAQIYVDVYDAGFGTEWLVNCMARFEQAVKTKDYGNGKTGVQFHFQTEQNSGDNRKPENVKTDKYTIYFDENINYNKFYNEKATLDISEAICKTNSFDNKNIVDKLNTQQKQFYVREENKYFGLPYYSGTYGLVYKKDVFKEQNLYLINGKDGSKDQDWFDGEETATKKRSPGPDGDLKTTWDNGLPATYSQFNNLLTQMRKKGKDKLIPVYYNDHYKDQYFTLLTSAAAVQAQGKDATLRRLQMNGTCPAGELLDPTTLTPDANATTITSGRNGNGYELWRQKGLYDGLTFISNIISNPDNYVGDTAGGASHYITQEKFIRGVGDAECAIYNDGTWFECECTKWSKDWRQQGDHNLGFMPLPRPNGAKLGKYNLIDTSQSLCYLANNDKNKDPSNLAANLDFIRFIYSDGELQNFSLLTNSFFGVNYDMTDEQYNNGLSSFGKSVYDMRKSCGYEDIVFTTSTNYFFSNNLDNFHPQWCYRLTNIPSKQPICEAFMVKDYYPEQYFKEMCEHFADPGFWSMLND